MVDRKETNVDAVFIDIGDTLVPSGVQEIQSPRVVDAISNVATRAHVFIATGRLASGIEVISRQIELVTPSIVLDGVQVVDINTGEVTHERTLDDDQIERCLDIADRDGYDRYFVEVDGSKGESPVQGPAIMYLRGVPDGHEVIDSTQLNDMNLVASERRRRDTEPGCYDLRLIHAEATKGFAGIQLIRRFGLDASKCVAIGNESNDLPLFDVVGRSFAVANGEPDVLDAADVIVPAQQEDGIMHMFDHLGLIDR